MPTSAYFSEDTGKRVPSVTTVIGRYKDTYNLQKWQSYATREIDQDMVREAFEETKRPSRAYILSKIAQAPGPYDVARDAATAGTICHQWIEDHAFGRPLTDYSGEPAELLSLAQKGWGAFVEWWKANGFEPKESEVHLTGEVDGFGYGGTPDMVALDSQGRLCVLDWKCCNGGPYSDHKIQLATYRELLRQNGRKVGPAHLVRVAKRDGGFHHHSWPDESLELFWEQFRAYRVAYEREKEIKKL